jgi:hypothetical protein
MDVAVGLHAPRVQTDRDGRFEITGVGKDEKLTLRVTSGPGSAVYIGSSTELPGGDPGLGVVRADVRVRRGIPVRARVVEKGSGRDVEADVRYLVLAPNTNHPPGFFSVLPALYRQADGTYLGAALPGPGAVVVRRAPKRYLPATASQRDFFKADRLPKGYLADDALWVAGFTGREPEPLPVGQFQAVAFLNPEKDAAAVEVKLELDPGEPRTGSPARTAAHWPASSRRNRTSSRGPIPARPRN